MSSQNQVPLTHEQVMDIVIRAIYDNSTAAVFFHTAIAEQVGLGATESKAMLILNGLGPLTAGEIAQHTSLNTGSATSLIDRLEKKGFVHRVRDPEDRRKVIVEPDKAKFAELAAVFHSLQGDFADLFEGYSDEQLLMIAGFLDRASQRSHRVIARLMQIAAQKDSTQ